MGLGADVIRRLAIEVIADVDRARRALDGLGDSAAGGWAGKIAGAGAMAFAAVGTAAAGVAGFGLSVAMEAETAAVGFETLLGSAEAADAYLGQLQEFAASTPFEFPELRNAASRFIAVGVEADRVIPIMTTLGDATSAMGTGAEGIQRATTALTQMSQKGKVTAEEMMQLTEAGIPAWDALAAVLGTDVAGAMEQVSAGGVQAEQMFQALETGAGDALGRVSGMMEQQSGTLAGLFSTLKDTVSLALGDMMGPAVDAIKGQMPAITETIGGALELIGPQVSVFAEGFVGLLGDLLPQVTPLLGAVAEALGETFAVLGPALAEVGPAVLEVFEALLPVLPELAEVFASLAVAAVPVVELLADFITSIPPDVLANIVVGFIAFKQVSPILNGLGGAFKLLQGAMGPWGLAIMAIALLAPLIIEHWGPISEFFGKVGEVIGDVFSGIADAVGNAVGWVLDHLDEALAAVIWFATGGPLRWAIGQAIELFFSMADGVGDAIGGVIQWFLDLPTRIWNAIGDAGSMLLGVGADIVRGLWNGLISMGDWLWDSIWGWVRDVLPGPVKWALGIDSPSKVMAELGAFAGEGLAVGITGSADMVAAAARSLAEAAVPDLEVAGSWAGGGTLPVAAPPAAAGGNVTHVTVLEVHGNVWTERELTDAVRNELIRTGQINHGGVLGGLG